MDTIVALAIFICPLLAAAGLAVIVGFTARARGRTFFNWFALSLLITPVGAVLILIFMKRLPR